MYYDYFGFRQPPFKITPDTNLFYPGGERGAVLEALVYAVLNGEGIVKVVGEVGSGKTMLCRMLERELPERVEIVYLANPSLSPEHTLHAIAFELGLEIPAGASRFEAMNRLQEYLLQRHSQNGQVVVFVEEAQGMPLATLEEIRLLSNLETQQNKLLQIILFGQPELDNMLATPEIRQLKERITYSFRLNPFESDDIRDYLNSRVRACGYRTGALFDRAAVREIERYSNGLLRRINILADKALLAAYAENSQCVTAKHIKKAAIDSEFSSKSRSRWQGAFWKVVPGAVILALLALIGVAITWGGPPIPLSGAGDDTEPARSARPEQDNASISAGSEALRPAPDDQSPPAAGTRSSEAIELPEKSNSNGVRETTVQTAPASVSTDTPDEDPGTVADKSETEESVVDPADPADINDYKTEQPYTIIEIGGVDGARLSGGEADRLLRQLREVPPETAVLSDNTAAKEVCKHCRSIIYRPLKRVENL